MPILNLNEGVPRTFYSARNMNARVPRTCFENILPGSCTENIIERAPELAGRAEITSWVVSQQIKSSICNSSLIKSHMIYVEIVQATQGMRRVDLAIHVVDLHSSQIMV